MKDWIEEALLHLKQHDMQQGPIIEGKFGLKMTGRKNRESFCYQ